MFNYDLGRACWAVKLIIFNFGLYSPDQSLTRSPLSRFCWSWEPNCRCSEMASVCRSAVITVGRTAAFRSKMGKQIPRAFIFRTEAPVISRSACAAIECVGSLMPLHSAIASARLKSFIAEDSSRWSWFSQGNVISPHYTILSTLLTNLIFLDKKK